MEDLGFLGTRALLFMDVVTIWFAMLPVLLAGAIALVHLGHHAWHIRMQVTLFVMTVLMVLLFEVGVRVTGGFVEYVQHSSVDPFWMTVLLVVHVIVAVASVILWVWLLYSARKAFSNQGRVGTIHKRYGKILFGGLSLTSLMGVLIYLLLFVI